MLNLEELKQLVSFADSGTLAKVAEDFHISTPSVTRSMKNLEESFGVSLFVRSKNKIALNETGRVAVTYARKLLQETEQMLTAVQDFDERQHTITVKSCAPAPLWELLKKIEKKYPGFTISSGICQNNEVVQFMEKNACDYAILPYQLSLPEWSAKEFMREHLFVCVPSGHELAKYKELHFCDLNGFNFLLKSELGFWDSLCREKMPASKFLVQTDESIFNEIVNASSLPCFTTDYFANLGSMYPGRVNIPIIDAEANVVFWIYSALRSSISHNS